MSSASLAVLHLPTYIHTATLRIPGEGGGIGTYRRTSSEYILWLHRYSEQRDSERWARPYAIPEWFEPTQPNKTTPEVTGIVVVGGDLRPSEVVHPTCPGRIPLNKLLW